MSFLLDTVVLSELRKTQPSRNVTRWLKMHPPQSLYISVVSIGEIERGIEKARKTDAAFSRELTRWLDHLLSHYDDQVLPVTANISRLWGRLSSNLGHEGADLLIAATAITHNFTVVTRNVKHFAPTGARVLDPFIAKP